LYDDVEDCEEEEGRRLFLGFFHRSSHVLHFSFFLRVMLTSALPSGRTLVREAKRGNFKSKKILLKLVMHHSMQNINIFDTLTSAWLAFPIKEMHAWFFT
jgi:hypothetical protein